MNVISQHFRSITFRNCPHCGSKNVESMIKKSQVEPSTSERFICKDCDKWFLGNDSNAPGSGGREEMSYEVIDSRDQPGEKDSEHPQKS